MSERIEGLSALRAKLLELGAIAGQKIMQSAARAAMKPVLEAAKRLAPVSHGHLRDSLRLASRKPKSGSLVASAGITLSKTVEGEILVDNDPDDSSSESFEIVKGTVGAAGYRWHFAEFGTVKMKSHPFLRPAMIQQRGAVVELFKTLLLKKIARAIKKQGAR